MKKLIILFICCGSCVAFSQDKHRIDKDLETCLSFSENQTTSGMTICEQQAEQNWDKELNHYYQLVMKNLSPSAVEVLKTSQRDWLKYRDKEFEFISTFYFEEMQGTMWSIIAAGHRTEIVKKRALELKSYYDILTFE